MNGANRSIIWAAARHGLAVWATVLAACLAGCDIGGIETYQNTWLYPNDISTVYVEMFDSRSFRRGHEYALTDAICKRIEAQTPYKIVSDRDAADSVLSGQMSIYSGVLSRERYEGVALEMETTVVVSVSWKNLKTGELLINNENVMASGSYSPKLPSQQGPQGFEYAADVAVNRAAERVVELMETSW